MTTFTTILAGVVIFVLGQVVLKLFIEPVHALKRTVSDIALALINHANVYCNPGVGTPESEAEVRKELRNLASILHAQLHLIPQYNKTRMIFNLPSLVNVDKSCKLLIGVSNSLDAKAAHLATANANKADKIRELLGIHKIDE